MLNRVHKACACVLRGNTVLAFRHPTKGKQLTKGKVDPGEEPGAAARRELREESGLDYRGAVEAFGCIEQVKRSGPREDGPMELHIWHLFVLCPTLALPQTWSYVVQSGEAEKGLTFEYFWHPIDGPADGFEPMYVEVIDRLQQHLARRRD